MLQLDCRENVGQTVSLCKATFFESKMKCRRALSGLVTGQGRDLLPCFECHIDILKCSGNHVPVLGFLHRDNNMNININSERSFAQNNITLCASSLIRHSCSLFSHALDRYPATRF